VRWSRTQSLEVNVEHHVTPSMRLGASMYFNTYRDLIIGVADSSGDVVLQNGLEARARGLEVSWSMVRRAGIQARASYSTLFNGDAASNAWTSPPKNAWQQDGRNFRLSRHRRE
jgi:hypothetical protein